MCVLKQDGPHFATMSMDAIFLMLYLQSFDTTDTYFSATF